MTQEIRVSKATKNVLTATDPNDFIFHSDYNTFKILATDTFSPTSASGGNSHTVAHGQDFIPFVFTMIKYADGRVSLAGSHSAVALGSSFQLASVKVDATNITYTFTNNTGGNYTPTLRYYICEIPL